MTDRRTVKMQNFQTVPYGTKILFLIFAKLETYSLAIKWNVYIYQIYQK